MRIKSFPGLYQKRIDWKTHRAAAPRSDPQFIRLASHHFSGAIKKKGKGEEREKKERHGREKIHRQRIIQKDINELLMLTRVSSLTHKSYIRNRNHWPFFDTYNITVNIAQIHEF